MGESKMAKKKVSKKTTGKKTAKKVPLPDQSNYYAKRKAALAGGN